MNKKSFYILLFSFLTLSCNTKKSLKEGDLLFKDTQNNQFSSAIKAVTPSKQYSFSHVAILFKEQNQWKVLEAVPKKGVQIVPLSVFKTAKERETIKIVVGRLRNKYPYDLAKFIEYGKKQVGKKYDNAFVWNDSTFYCSELAYKMFVYAGQNKAFIPKPMTFKEKGETEFHPTWINYYKSLKVPIPEGKLGINPNAMANSQSVELLFELK